MFKKDDKNNEKNSKVAKFEDKKKEKDANTFEGFISKIKISKKEDIPTIHYKKESEKASKETVVNGKEKPLDEFIAALQSLAAFFLDICEIEGKEDDTIITGVSFSEAGIVITAQIELTQNGINAPLCLNSPHVAYESNNGSFEIPAAVKEQLTALKQCAIAYIQGDTKEKQGNIFAEA